MIKPINIHDSNIHLELKQGIYHVDFIGGWNINPNDFKILLKNREAGDYINLTRARWPIQSYEFGKKAKRYYTFQITKTGQYQLDFENSKNVEIKWLNLPLWSLIFTKLIDNSSIMIYIHPK